MFIYRSQYAVWETAQSHDVVPVESPLAMLDKTNAVNKSKQGSNLTDNYIYNY